VYLIIAKQNCKINHPIYGAIKKVKIISAYLGELSKVK
jgi:hypothetical protein